MELRRFTLMVKRSSYTKEVRCYGTTVDGDRMWIHKKADLSDRESFLAVAEIAAFDEEITLVLSDAEKQFRELLLQAAVQKSRALTVVPTEEGSQTVEPVNDMRSPHPPP